MVTVREYGGGLFGFFGPHHHLVVFLLDFSWFETPPLTLRKDLDRWGSFVTGPASSSAGPKRIIAPIAAS